jgi:hypothetical protein
MKEEIWKLIDGFDCYYVSNQGRVKSLKFGKERILKTPKNDRGYLLCRLRKNGETFTKLIHKLVAISFLNHMPNGFDIVVDHINDIKIDNRVENLQLITARENAFKTQGKYSSRYKGVTFCNSRMKFLSRFYHNGSSIHLGYFNNEEEANQAYQKTLKELL